MGDPSPIPAALVAVLGLGAVVLGVLGIRSARFARYDAGARSLVRSAVPLGVAIFCAVLVGLAFRHYGGTVGDGITVPRTSACDAWWYAMGASHGNTTQSGGTVACHRAAVAAVWPAIGFAAAAGLALAALFAAAVAMSRRRHDSNLADLTAN